MINGEGLTLKTGDHEDLIARGVGIKFPMIGVGWGRDINGDPVPAHPEKTGEYHPDFRTDTSLWKAGPVDFPWDEERGVWAGNPNNINRAVLLEENLSAAEDKLAKPEDLPSALASPLTKRLDGSWGIDTEKEKIILHNRSNLEFNSYSLGEWKVFMGIKQFIPIECTPDNSSSSSGDLL
jgi:hypothetical protein